MATAPIRFRHGRPVFDGHQELTALGVSYVDVTGGEPALHKEMVAAVEHARWLGTVVVVSGQTVDELDEVVAFAQGQRVGVRLSPMFSSFSAQSEVCPAVPSPRQTLASSADFLKGSS
ncbi:hypothetical protein GCM10022247_70730 [Allokutzneria multivorans]|uniref:Uncharacterized protein n=1 Tax=Allokutzneria multivorans TaxID=1142134 RepID=A0ABP7U3C2_9PSEU